MKKQIKIIYQLYLLAAGTKGKIVEFLWKKKLKIIILKKKDLYNEEQKKICEYIRKGRKGVELFNYEFVDKYKKIKYKILYDKNCDLYYSFIEGKKMYFKRTMKKQEINKYINTLQIEQDRKSPHCYIDEEIKNQHMRVVIDCGVAEGNFALSIIDNADELYLFECDKDWVEALKHTFTPYKDKVHIKENFVSNKSYGSKLRLDDIFKNRKDIDMVKMDIEGEEENAIKGMSGIMENNPQIIVLACAYHKFNSEENIKSEIEKIDFSLISRDGYMVFIYDIKQKFPYFRRGVLKITKSQIDSK